MARSKATIARKTIRAPFSGVLGIRQVNLGQYLAAGQAIVSLQSLESDLREFRSTAAGRGAGASGRTSARHQQEICLDGSSAGTVTAIDSVVNEPTRNIQVQATLANPGGKLRPGMFVQVELRLGQSRSVIPLPASAINYAPYGDSVFVVTDLKDPKGNIVSRRAPAVREGRRLAR